MLNYHCINMISACCVLGCVRCCDDTGYLSHEMTHGADAIDLSST